MRAVASGTRTKRPAGSHSSRGRKRAKRANAGARGPWLRRLGFATLAVAVLGVGYASMGAGFNTRLGTKVAETLASGADTVLRLAGVSVQDVTVDGRRFARAHEILAALDVSSGASMVRFDPVKARQRVLDVDWVRDATVSRLYPGTIHVNVTEYVPFALWRHKGHTSIISESGEVVSQRSAPWLASLPVVDGVGAAKAAARILPLLKARPNLRARIRTIERIGGRRWNLRLDNSVKVMLPATRIAAALDALIAIDANTGLLARDIILVDMRIPDRLTVRAVAGRVNKIGLGKPGSGTVVADKNT
ncbi:MAG: cell division protein FtsQ/DivIB [Alphaproteobacteria bacterium]